MMKSSDEVVADLLKRREQYQAERRQEHKAILKTVLPIVSLTLVLLASGILRQMQPIRAEMPIGESKSAFAESRESSSDESESTLPYPTDISDTAATAGTETSATKPAVPTKARVSDSGNVLTIGGKDYSATEGAETLPDGYIFIREITAEESNATELTGYKIYVLAQQSSDTYWGDFWLYQPAKKLTAIPYSGETIPLIIDSKDCPEWIYTHWAPAPPPPERGEST